MRQVVALVLAVALAGCGRGDGEASLSAGDLPRLAADRSAQARAFTWTSKVAGRTYGVDGLVEDDYRYSATVRVDGTAAYQEVVLDDARYVRVLDAAALFGGAVPAAVDRLRGAWVADPDGAPSEFLTDTVPRVPLDPRFVRDRVRTLETIGSELRGMREYNTDALSYLPKDDKFPRHEADGTRFDRVPIPYAGQEPPTTLAGMRKFFEYVSAWADESGLRRVERLIQLPRGDDEAFSELVGGVVAAGSPRLRSVFETPDRTIAETFLTGPAPAGSVPIAVPSGARRTDLDGLLARLRKDIRVPDDPSPVYGPIT